MNNQILPLHVPIRQFSVKDNCLQIGSITLTELANRVGGTPFYAYDRRLLNDRLSMLRQHIPTEVSVHYAIKANPMPAVVEHMSARVDGLDVASAGEMRIALDTGMDPSKISIAGPGKKASELSQAIASGVTINMESENEMESIAALAKKQNKIPPVAIRVNPNFELKTSGMKMGGGPKQFGVDSERVPEMLKRLSVLPMEFLGFHIYAGSQNLKAESIQQTQESTIELALELSRYAPVPIRLLNIGGGFGIPYFPGDQPLDIASVGKNLHHLINQLKSSLPHAEIVLELGRYLVGEAGVYVCQVIDKKVSRGHVYLITDGGLHHQLAASGNFGQIIRKNYPVLVGNKVFGTERETVSVVGPLCTPLDLLADKLEMAKAEVGDLVVVFQSGAYGLSASPTSFLSHPEPVEVLV